MNNNSTIAQDIEHLLKKASEANTVIIAETTRFLQQLASSKMNTRDMAGMQKQLFKDAVNLFVKVNLQHTANLIDMGVAISKHLNEKFNGTPGANSGPVGAEVSEKPAFELKTSAQAGKTATTAFLLNSDKSEPVKCELFHSVFTDESNPENRLSVISKFTPQSFELISGASQRIDMTIAIPVEGKPGLYRSHIKVQGFEHTHFDVLLEVAEPTFSAPVEEAKVTKKAAPKKAAKKSSSKGPPRAGNVKS